jgi:hypothetical protein
MTTLVTWLDELDALMTGQPATPADEHRLDALIDRGMVLLADPTLQPAPVGVDPQQLDRVQRRLRTIADRVAGELDEIRRERRQLVRARTAHVGYHAATSSA